MSADVEVALKLGYALLMGGFLGMEREVHKKVAGLRTHMIVCLSSALLMVLSTDVATDMGLGGDPTRIAAGVMTGIGFLGAGTIIKHGATVHGLTTAASIWTSAAVGLAVGAGYYLASALVVLLTLFTLLLVQRADEYLRIHRRRAHMMIYLTSVPGIITRVREAFDDMGLEVGEYSVSKNTPERGQMILEAQLYDTGGMARSRVAERLLELDDVLGVDFY
jgi:putative Mg2+ transporter-C (MgtC) family protein